MEVIVQSLVREYKLSTPNEKIMTMARSLHKAKMVHEKVLAEKKMKSLKFIRFQDQTKVPVSGGQSRASGAICKAINLNGKACKNKSVCNGFCKRHQLDTSSINLLGSVKSLVCE